MAPSKQQRTCGSGTPAGDRPPPLRPEVYHLSKHGKWPMCRPARQLCPKRRLFEPRTLSVSAELRNSAGRQRSS